jgi:hypothetical protein
MHILVNATITFRMMLIYIYIYITLLMYTQAGEMVVPEGPCVAVDGYVMVPLLAGGAVQLNMFSLEAVTIDGFVLTAIYPCTVFANAYSGDVKEILEVCILIH